MMFESSVTDLGKRPANMMALVCFMLVFFFELNILQGSFRDIVAFLAVLGVAAGVWYSDVLRQWNCALVSYPQDRPRLNRTSKQASR